ncbi:MAG: GYD domain-containing protein [Anaerolineales bacterium]|nr:GYD domain-containing protein [Anaerolineales bacterium]
MATYFMFGKYSTDSIKDISAKRTEKAEELVAGFGGEIKSGYALLGDIDLILIAEFPSVEQAMQASVGLAKLLGISFRTSPAVGIEEFDKLVG